MSAETANSVTSFSLWIPLASAVVGGLVVAFFNHFFTKRRDFENEKRKIRIQYLIEAYRRLENFVDKQNQSEQIEGEFESAVADIQLLGTKTQVDVTLNLLRGLLQGGNTNLDVVLRELRDELRKALGLEEISEPVLVFRFRSRSRLGPMESSK